MRYPSSSGDGQPVINILASKVESPYEVGSVANGGFVETVARSAFSRTLGENPDCVLLLDHTGPPYARTKSKTMTLRADHAGLWARAELDPDDPDVQALLPKMRRGDLDGASMAFRVTDQDWSTDFSERRIKSLSLHNGDISICTFGCNPESVAMLQGAQRSAGRSVFIPDHTTRAAQEVFLWQRKLGIDPRSRPAPKPKAKALSATDYAARIAAMRARCER